MNRFCIRVVSDKTVEYGSGDEIQLLVNGVQEGIALTKGGIDEEKCLYIKNTDQITLQNSGTDGVRNFTHRYKLTNFVKFIKIAISKCQFRKFEAV